MGNTFKLSSLAITFGELLETLPAEDLCPPSLQRAGNPYTLHRDEVARNDT
jgi:hypothetical protein